MRGNYQRRNAEKSSSGSICNGILTKTLVMRYSGQRFANISRVKPHGWKEECLGEVSKAQRLDPAQVSMVFTTTFSTPGRHAPGNITHSASDTDQESSSVEALPGQRTRNREKPSGGSSRLRLI